MVFVYFVETLFIVYTFKNLNKTCFVLSRRLAIIATHNERP